MASQQVLSQVPLASLSFAILRVQPEMNSLAGWAVGAFCSRNLPWRDFRDAISALCTCGPRLSPTTDDAHAVTDKIASFLSLFHAAEGSVGAHGTDADVKALFQQPQGRAFRRSRDSYRDRAAGLDEVRSPERMERHLPNRQRRRHLRILHRQGSHDSLDHARPKLGPHRQPATFSGGRIMHLDTKGKKRAAASSSNRR